MKLTKNFDLEEFACHCGCGTIDVDEKLVNCLQILRNVINDQYKDKERPILINSACRCWDNNNSVGGSVHSYHLAFDLKEITNNDVVGEYNIRKCQAADIHVPDLTIGQLYECALTIPEFVNGGIGLYKDFVHLDTRGHRVRWEDFE